jgi:K+-sensing histidine kinase KdpD
MEKLALEDLNEDLKVVDTALVEGWTKTGEVQSELLKMFAKNLKKEIGRRLSTEFLPERVNIAAIVRNEALRAKDKFGDFEISIESDKPIKLIEADHYMLKAIVRQMMEESASSFAGERSVKVTLKEEKGMLSLTHEDTGAHVPEGKDPMWKVQDYVNKHDGYLSYHNKPEGGRRFMLTLPKERKLKA